jgi:enoyl-CoA hydratase/carnithine racemase
MIMIVLMMNYIQARRVVRGVLDVLQAGHGGWPDETRSEVARHGALIHRCFHEASSAEDVLQRLSDELLVMVDNSNRNDDDTSDGSSGSIAWVKRTMDALQRCSPMSLQLTYEQLRRGASMDLKQCLSMVRPVEAMMMMMSTLYLMI